MLNPIEYVFSKVKTTARRILGEIRSHSAENNENEKRLQDIIIDAVNEVTINDCVGYMMRVLRNISIASAGEVYVD